MTDLYTDAGRSILRELFEFYCDRELDDAEYIPVVKTIVRGIEKSMSEQSLDSQAILSVKNDLLEFNRGLYMDLWLKHAQEDDAGRELDLDGEKESAAYYFDYIYEHGKYPH